MSSRDQSCSLCIVGQASRWLAKSTLPVVIKLSACDSGMCILPIRMGADTLLEKKEWLNQRSVAGAVWSVTSGSDSCSGSTFGFGSGPGSGLGFSFTLSERLAAFRQPMKCISSNTDGITSAVAAVRFARRVE